LKARDRRLQFTVIVAYNYNAAYNLQYVFSTALHFKNRKHVERVEVTCPGLDPLASVTDTLRLTENCGSYNGPQRER
jgi:hypothetical protein